MDPDQAVSCIDHCCNFFFSFYSVLGGISIESFGRCYWAGIIPFICIQHIQDDDGHPQCSSTTALGVARASCFPR